MIERIQKLRELFPDYGIDALLVTEPLNRRYLSGFTGSSGTLLISRDRSLLLTDFRYVEQAREECSYFDVLEIKDNLDSTLNDLLSSTAISRLGAESDHLTYRRFSVLKEKLVSRNIIPVSGVVQGLRVTKDAFEINCIEKSMQLLDRALPEIMNKIKPGITEREISLELEFITRHEGAEEKAFSFIVASGPRSALPHGTASARKLQPGDLVTIDFGVICNGYASDLTRTFAVGNSCARQREIYAIVLEAQLAALDTVKAGIPAKEVDLTARSIIEKKAYGPNFGHGTGHGVGLEVHENPRIAKNEDTVLKEGMVITVEPGIYLPGWGGVRIEDTVVVGEKGCRPLATFPKDRLICI